MRFAGPLIVVRDIEISRTFYEGVLGQKVACDLDENVVFKSGFAIHLQAHFARLTGIDEDDIIQKSNNAELYFEEGNLDAFIGRLREMEFVRYVHGMVEQPWGQRVIRLYDPDMHIIEVGEPIESVVTRFLESGLSVEETAKRTSMPEEFVRQCVEGVRS